MPDLNPLVSIIIAHYRNSAMLLRCLESLAAITYEPFEIILVDNGSTENVGAVIAERFPLIKTIRNEKNLGFAPANNQGVALAEGSYLLLLNDDAVVTPDFLSVLVQQLSSDVWIAGCQPKLKLHDQDNLLDSVGILWTRTGFLDDFGTNQPDYGQFDTLREIFTFRGACVLLRTQVFRQLGGFDDKFFVYAEDNDLAMRIWLAGYRILYVPDAVVYHRLNATASTLPLPFVLYHANKNRLRSYIKNLELTNLLVVLACHLPMYILSSALSLIRLDVPRAQSVLGSIAWNISNLKDTLAQRRMIQRDLRKVRDRDFLPRVSGHTHFSRWVYLHLRSFSKN